jgi:type I restriction enzyme S subunit
MSFNKAEFGQYPQEWSIGTLGEYIEVLTDYHANGAYKKLKENVELLDEENYSIMIRTTNFEQSDFSLKSFKYINEHAYNFLSKTKVYFNDILMNKIANAGSVYIMPKLNKPVSLAMNLFLIRFNEKVIVQKYAYYFMKNYEAYIKTRAQGSVTKTITKENVRKLEIAFPNVQEQKAIVKILSDLEEKIDTNNQINRKLEEMVQATFKQWFVDFEFTNEDGEPYKSSGGEMVESELGLIPKGWQVVELNNVADLTMGLSPKSSSYNSDRIGMPLLNGAADFENGLINAKKYTTEPTRLCKKNDLVFCIRATIGNITFSDKEYCLGRGVASLTPKSDKFTGIIYFNLLMSMNQLIANATGSVILGLSKPDINNLKLVLPDEKTLERFSGISNSTLKGKHNNEFETKKLVEIRDSLLPKLMSGDIRVLIDSNEN